MGIVPVERLSTLGAVGGVGHEVFDASGWEEATGCREISTNLGVVLGSSSDSQNMDGSLGGKQGGFVFFPIRRTTRIVQRW